MSVIIKGMTLREFAECLGVDKIVDTTNWFYTFCGHSIIDLPPHGRLIDADALIKAWECEKESYREIVESLMEEAPTIIEAEVEE